MPRTAQFTDEFLRIEVTELYRLGIVGPKWDRARRHAGASPVYRATWHYAPIPVTLDCQIEAGTLIVTGTMLESAELVRLGSYSQGLFGGSSRLVMLCPTCERRCFRLYAPTPSTLIRPDGTNNQRRLLCLHCHHLSIPSWRHCGGPERAALQRRTLAEKLGDNPVERQLGVSTTRHQKRLARWLRAEGRVLAVGGVAEG
jgi:hypothetical protein